MQKQTDHPPSGKSADSHGQIKADLVAVLGRDRAVALGEWAEANRREVRLPRRTWKSEGYTGAVLAALVVTEATGAARKVIVKTCPGGAYAREGAAHRQALLEAPSRFRRRHLVDQVYDPFPVGDGSYLTFQEIAGGRLDKVRPLSTLSRTDLATACGIIAAKLFTDWNEGDCQMRTLTLPEFLQVELRGAFGHGGTAHSWASACSLVDTDAPWVRTAEGEDPMPNVFLMAAGTSAALSPTLDCLLGRSHSDLHLQNVLVPRPPSPRSDEFWLVDLTAYTSLAPLTRDPVNLLLSVVTQRLPDLGDRQREALLAYLVAPDRAPASDLPVVLRDTALEIYSTGLKCLLSVGLADEWIAQFLASMQAHAILFTSFERLSPQDRWWFVRLAGRAGAEFLRMHDLYAPFDVRPIRLTQNAFSLSRDGSVSG